jgi:hypothetical protein
MNFNNPANCAGTDTEDWFTEVTIYSNKDTLKRICNACDAKVECLNYALEYNVLGYWAGTSDLERGRMRKKLNIIAKPILISEWEMADYYA